MQLQQLAGVLPELVVNTVGVLLGGLGALGLARWQLVRQSSAERERSREHLKAVMDWTRLELGGNLELVRELERAFQRDRAGRPDLLRWATTTLRNALRQAGPAVAFYVSCCGEEDSAERVVAELEGRIAAGRGEATRARELMDTM